MKYLRDQLDAFLNVLTMYRLTLYSLIGLIVVGVVFGFTGVLSINGGQLIITTLIVSFACFASNRIFATIFKAATGSESWLITALILALILPPTDSLTRGLLIAATGILAMASKYLLAFRAKHLFNPAAVAAFIMSVGGWLPVIWWVGSPPMLPFSILVGILIVRKIRKFAMVSTFIAMALLTMVGVSILNHADVGQAVHNLFFSWPLIFAGTVMLTEPMTTPPFRYHQLLMAVIVGLIFSSQVKLGPISTTPQFALLAGNLFGYLFSPKYKLRLRFLERRQIATSLFSYSFAIPRGSRLAFMPGQYMEWTLPHAKSDGRGNRRTFSIASSPTESVLEIGIREPAHPSSFKRALAGLASGEAVMAGQLSGNFVLPQSEQPMVWIAGGIGITPFRSMAKYLLDTHQKRDITLFYLASSADELAYKTTFDQSSVIGLRAIYITDGSRLTLDALHTSAPALKDSLVYIAGPQGMVTNYNDLVRQAGVPPYRIITDHFSGY